MPLPGAEEDLQRIEIYKADSSGNQIGPGSTNVYTFTFGDPEDCDDWNGYPGTNYPPSSRYVLAGGASDGDAIGIARILPGEDRRHHPLPVLLRWHEAGDLRDHLDGRVRHRARGLELEQQVLAARRAALERADGLVRDRDGDEPDPRAAPRRERLAERDRAPAGELALERGRARALDGRARARVPARAAGGPRRGGGRA